MLSTKELFGLDPVLFKDLKYVQVLELKKQRAKDLIAQELNKSYLHRDYHRITQLSKAIKNMDKLLNEMKDDECTKTINNNNLLQSVIKFSKNLAKKICTSSQH